MREGTYGCGATGRGHGDHTFCEQAQSKQGCETSRAEHLAMSGCLLCPAGLAFIRVSRVRGTMRTFTACNSRTVMHEVLRIATGLVSLGWFPNGTALACRFSVPPRRDARHQVQSPLSKALLHRRATIHESNERTRTSTCLGSAHEPLDAVVGKPRNLGCVLW